MGYLEDETAEPEKLSMDHNNLSQALETFDGLLTGKPTTVEDLTTAFSIVGGEVKKHNSHTLNAYHQGTRTFPTFYVASDGKNVHSTLSRETKRTLEHIVRYPAGF